MHDEPLGASLVSRQSYPSLAECWPTWIHSAFLCSHPILMIFSFFAPLFELVSTMLLYLFSFSISSYKAAHNSLLFLRSLYISNNAIIPLSIILYRREPRSPNSESSSCETTNPATTSREPTFTHLQVTRFYKKPQSYIPLNFINNLHRTLWLSTETLRCHSPSAICHR